MNCTYTHPAHFPMDFFNPMAYMGYGRPRPYRPHKFMAAEKPEEKNNEELQSGEKPIEEKQDENLISKSAEQVPQLTEKN